MMLPWPYRTGLWPNDEFVAWSRRYLLRLWWPVVDGVEQPDPCTCTIMNQTTGESRDYTPTELMALLEAGKLRKVGNMAPEQAEALLAQLRKSKGSLNDQDIQQKIQSLTNQKLAA